MPKGLQGVHMSDVVHTVRKYLFLVPFGPVVYAVFAAPFLLLAVYVYTEEILAAICQRKFLRENRGILVRVVHDEPEIAGIEYLDLGGIYAERFKALGFGYLVEMCQP